MSMFFKSSQMAADAATTRDLRNNAHDNLSRANQSTIIKAEKKIVELRIIDTIAEASRVSAANQVALTMRALAEAQDKFDDKVPTPTWEAESKKISKNESRTKFFSIFPNYSTTQSLASKSASQRDIKVDEFEKGQPEVAKDEAGKEADIQILRERVVEAKKVEAIKSKRAADAARELAEAIAKLEHAGEPVQMSEAQTRATAWQKARKAAADMIKTPLTPQHSKVEVARPIATKEMVRSRGASQLAAEAAVNRNIELEEDSKIREYNEQDIEAVKLMRTVVKDDILRLKAQADFSQLRINQLNTEALKKKKIDAENALIIEEEKQTNLLDVEAKMSRSQIAEANRERLQLIQDEADAARIRFLASERTSKVKESETLRLQMLEKAKIASANMQRQKELRAKEDGRILW